MTHLDWQRETVLELLIHLFYKNPMDAVR